MKPGNAMPLRAMPVGTIVHNVELKIGRGGQMARAAGAYAQLVGRDQGYAILRLNSGEQRLVHGGCMATVGAVSNPDHSNQSIGKAGRNRWLGWRPSRARRRDEPGRPSAWRRRGPHLAAAGIRSRPGASRPRARRPAPTRRTTKYILRSRHARKGR